MNEFGSYDFGHRISFVTLTQNFINSTLDYLTKVFVSLKASYVTIIYLDNVTGKTAIEVINSIPNKESHSEFIEALQNLNVPKKFISDDALREYMKSDGLTFSYAKIDFKITEALPRAKGIPVIMFFNIIGPKSHDLNYRHFINFIGTEVNQRYSSYVINSTIEAAIETEKTYRTLEISDILSRYINKVNVVIPDIDIVVWTYSFDYNCLSCDASSSKDFTLDFFENEGVPWSIYKENQDLYIPDIKNVKIDSPKNDVSIDSFLKNGWKSCFFSNLIIGGNNRGCIAYFRKTKGDTMESYQLFYKITKREVVRYIVESDQVLLLSKQKERYKLLTPLLAIGKEASQRIHDIRDNITSLKGILLEIENKKGKNVNYKSKAIKGLDILEDMKMIISHQLLAFKDAREKKRREDINQFIRDRLDKFKLITDAEQVKFEYILVDAPLYCKIQFYYFERALENIISNGAYFAKQGIDSSNNFVRLIISDNGNHVGIAIVDSGPGIIMQNKDEIFEEGVSSKPGGFGVGLAIVKSIIQDHNGAIFVENIDKGGAKFVIQLPKIF